MYNFKIRWTLLALDITVVNDVKHVPFLCQFNMKFTDYLEIKV